MMEREVENPKHSQHHNRNHLLFPIVVVETGTRFTARDLEKQSRKARNGEERDEIWQSNRWDIEISQ
jgi:hypothetical protein